MTAPTDTEAGRKLGLVILRESLATLAIVDPAFTAKLPPRLTAETGIDVLSHAIEGYTTTWHNDFSDGFFLKAMQLVFVVSAARVTDGKRHGSPRKDGERGHHRRASASAMP